MNVRIALMTLFLTLVACKQDSKTGAGGGNGTDPTWKATEWQTSLLGQEGHGGDAIVCFSIPVERALVQQKLIEEQPCPPGQECPSQLNSSSSPRPRVTWRMTDEGRRSIRSAKPLEQHLAERIASKKILIDQLNQLSVEQGYRMVLQPLTKLPAAFTRVKEIHQKIGWLEQDGIASEYGLLDIDDSGFVHESEIDQKYCKELQAVVRRDNQLWYDRDILSHFDQAGKVLIQLHEELYAWGKDLDAINGTLSAPPAHETSTKTRRLILKALDTSADVTRFNQVLKDSGFSIMHWDDLFLVPTAVGLYMDTATCLAEQRFLKGEIQRLWGPYLFGRMASLFGDRYLQSNHPYASFQLRHNFPKEISNMIALTMGAETTTFGDDLLALQAQFERPTACEGVF